MATTQPSPLLAGPYATYNSPTTSNLTGGGNAELQDLTDRGRHMERKSLQKSARSWPTAQTTSVQILALPLRLWNMGPAFWLWKKKKGSMLSYPSAWGNFSTSPTWSTRPTAECGARSISQWVHRNLLVAQCQETETCMVRACYTPRQPLQNHPSRATWRVGDTVVGRGNAGWTTSKSGHSFPCQNCPQWPQSVKGLVLDWTELRRSPRSRSPEKAEAACAKRISASLDIEQTKCTHARARSTTSCSLHFDDWLPTIADRLPLKKKKKSLRFLFLLHELLLSKKQCVKINT